MAGNPLDGAALARLRALVKNMDSHNGSRVPVAELVELARDVRLEGGLTIDFDASAELGQPLVVVRVPEGPKRAACFDTLSPREAEIAALMAEGLRNKEIAARLFISVATVKDHVHRILEKTGLESRTAVVAAYKGS